VKPLFQIGLAVAFFAVSGQGSAFVHQTLLAVFGFVLLFFGMVSSVKWLTGQSDVNAWMHNRNLDPETIRLRNKELMMSDTIGDYPNDETLHPAARDLLDAVRKLITADTQNADEWEKAIQQGLEAIRKANGK